MELKEGMKVRATVDECDITIGREYVVTNFEKHSSKVYVIDDAGDRWPLMHNEYEPLPVADANEEAAPIKIEEGKYYRTRDGRKVGPAVPNHIAPISYPWNIPYRGAYHAYRVDGTSCIDDKDDVVAEWQDEPVADEPIATPASANDNQVPVATTLNFNTDAANTKLDEIIAKLNLIDEMASELGISFTTQQAA